MVASNTPPQGLPMGLIEFINKFPPPPTAPGPLASATHLSCLLAQEVEARDAQLAKLRGEKKALEDHVASFGPDLAARDRPIVELQGEVANARELAKKVDGERPEKHATFAIANTRFAALKRGHDRLTRLAEVLATNPLIPLQAGNDIREIAAELLEDEAPSALAQHVQASKINANGPTGRTS